MDRIIAGAGERGLKIILDHHRPNSEAQSKLWYTDFLPEEQWIADWQTLAKRYLGNDAVIGADLHNEPAGDATWGDGNPKTDWCAAAERAGNAILDVNPNWLIIVEGVEKIDKQWGYLVKRDIAPVILGEVGGRSVDPKEREGIWQRTLLKYLQDNGISFAYWSFNPNSSDTGGILQDDWQSLNREKQAMLEVYLAPKLAVRYPDAIDRTAVASAPRKNPLPAQPIKVQLATGRGEPRTGELSLQLRIVNQTAARVPLENVEVRYWLRAADVAGADWAAAMQQPTIWSGKAAGSGGVVHVERANAQPVIAQLMPGTTGSQTPYLRVTFAKESGIIPSWGTVEIQLRVHRPDKGTFTQSDHFSFKPSPNPTDNDAIALYFWGERIWGREPEISVG